MRILLIEDDPMIGKGLREALQDAGMSVDWTRNGEDGEAALSAGGYALVLLDIGLPGKNGIDVLRNVRKNGDKTPLLVITARDDLDDRVAGLDLGADDYVAKPFEMRELMARIRAVLRRYGGAAISVLGNGEIELDLGTHQVRNRGKSLVLSAREFALLQALMERPGAILSRAQLEDRLYGWGEELESNAISVYVHQLRKKLGEDRIHTVRGVGYYVGEAKGGA